MTIARYFADFLFEFSDLNGPAVEQAKTAMMDLTTAALAGANEDATVATRKAALSVWQHGNSPIWFAPHRTSAAGAALVNSTSASSLDLDDGHRAAAGHPGASIIPAVMATAAECKCSSNRILPAIALGYEIAVRVAASRDFGTLTTLVSGPWVGYGAAAAAAWLRGLEPHAIEQAIAIAGSTAPNLSAIAYSKVMGNHVKEGIPWATATALVAVELAARGFTGPVDLLDNESVYNRGRLLDGLGVEWAINGIYFKPYGCCRWAHSAIDAVLALQAEHGTNAADIDAIEIDTFSWALRLNNEVAPRTTESAQYSVPFCVAMALTKGAEAMVQITNEDLAHSGTIALARRIQLRIDPGFDTTFPQSVPARVVIKTKNERLFKEVLAPMGEPANPMGWAKLEDKFRNVAQPRLEEQHLEMFLAAFRDLRDGELGSLMETLQRPIPRLLSTDEPAVETTTTTACS
ncbi:MmgE/PrpD family protein [Mesorhizobium sp. M1E.F.Ca.ET.045.02.1.1]|uniref:MmgE/PrpD family protein n=1 Tax=Mesorhizobium sp. M1E.F.Ca.ET.045.02.1.1 TaxID=2493672 RepID=UPI000F750090|nr:MmgE/PrpD family protein [Mesorhizobium sp. M1E.F.Ca.ET.045.02.1.1]AZO22623.1 MmgE/PrpD family protein [Mesorhizobium sp. M1E.F.Ca.ET.045.02.1.1]